MKRRTRIMIFAIISPLILYIFYWRLTANDIELRLQKDDPFAIRFVVTNDQENDELIFIGQIIIFPKYKRIVLYSVNSDAYHNAEIIREKGLGSADMLESFSEFTNNNYIHIKSSQGSRLLDLMDGITFFSEKATIIGNAEYQYPRGMRYYPGEHIFEYLVKKENPMKKSKKNHYTYRDRNNQKIPAIIRKAKHHFRQESILLNLFWQRHILAENIEKNQLTALAMKLITTDFTSVELSSLLQYILKENVHLNVMEVPLEISQKRKGKQRLNIKDERAGQLFRDQISRYKIKWLKPDTDFATQILNGTEIQGLARRVKFSLQNMGIRVTDVDNYEHKPLPQTNIVSRSGDTLMARHLMDTMNLSFQNVSFYRKASDIEISLMLGQNFNRKIFLLK